MRYKLIAGLLPVTLLLSCTSDSVVGDQKARSPASAQQPHRSVASQQSGQIALYAGNAPALLITSPASIFAIHSNADAAELAKLNAYIDQNKSLLGLANETPLALKVFKVQILGAKTVVRFQQVVARHPGERFGYDVPIDGSMVVAILQDGALLSLHSSVKTPPTVSLVFKNPGFDFSGFTASEFALFFKEVLRAKDSDRVAKYFDVVAKNSGSTFRLASLSSAADPSATLKQFFAEIGPVSTVKILIEEAEHGQLALAEQGGTWYFELTKFFGLPVQFDVAIPTSPNEKLRAEHLREIRQGIAIDVYETPHYPAGIASPQIFAASETSPIDATLPGGKTASTFAGIMRYYQSHHQWVGFDGTGEHQNLNAFTDLTDTRDIDNAMWDPSINGILVGAGGSYLKSPRNSPTILAHEFTHAVVQFSSGLVYRGQSGALNEHIADIQAGIIAAELQNRPFDYLMAPDALNPAAAAPRQQILAMMAAGQGYTPAEIAKYNLTHLALRHLWAPELSFSDSMNTYKSVLQTYPATCVPSVTNDSCGVHSASGVPNRAVSMIIAKLGVDKVRDLIFNTFTTRLTPYSDFRAYAIALYDECQTGGELDPVTECPVIATSFASVGVPFPAGMMPGVPGPVATATPVPPPPPPVSTPAPVPGATPTPDQGPAPLPAPNTPQKSTSLKMCGIVSAHPSRNVTIIDNKYDTAILAAGYTTLSAGDYSAVYQFKCACVTGFIGQTVNSKGTFFNYFDTITAVQQRPDAACNGIVNK